MKGGKSMGICIISFSGRKDGNCAAFGAYVKDLYQGDAELYRFCDFSIAPCGACGYQCFQRSGCCPHSGDMEAVLLRAVSEADMTYFIVPNYCDYPCANFFLFQEREQFYFHWRPDRVEAYEKAPKRFIAVSNTEEEHFRQVFSCHVKNEPEILFLRARAFGRSSIAGDLLTSEGAKETIRGFVLS